MRALAVLLTGNQQHEPCSKAGKTGKKSHERVGFEDEAGGSLQQSGSFHKLSDAENHEHGGVALPYLSSKSLCVEFPITRKSANTAPFASCE